MAGGLIAGGIASAIANMASNTYASHLSFHENRELQKRNQQWQERMSNTAHQREIIDLRKAGINPIYTATGGQGASVGNSAQGGLMAQGSDVGTDFINSYANLVNLNNQVKVTNAQSNELETQSQLNISKSMEARANIQKILNDSSLSDVQRRYYEKQLSRYDDVINAQIKEQEANANQSNAHAKYTDERSRGTNIFDAIGNTSHSILERITGNKYKKPFIN